MRSTLFPLPAVAVALPLLLLGAPPAARTQNDASGGTGTVVTTPKPGRPTPRPRPKPSNTTRVSGTVKPQKTLTTGALAVAAEPRATVYLEPLKGGRALEGDVPPGERVFNFSKLLPGRYRVSAELAGYTADEKEVIVRANNFESVTLTLTPITSDVTVRTDAPSGMIMLGRGSEQPVGRPYAGGTLTIPDLRPGTYTIWVTPADVSYKAAGKTVVVPDNGSSLTVTIPLEKRLTEKEFAASSATDWQLPTVGGWSYKSGVLTTGGRGMALPRDDSFHYYKDFKLLTSVRMKNGVAVSFAVRAQNADSYYLVQLTGASAPDEPYRFRGFVVRPNERQPFGGSLSIRQFSKVIKPDRFFNLSITVKGSTITVEAEDPDYGTFTKVGTLTDSDNIFPIGAVGLVVAGGEQVEVGSFTVSPL